MPVDPLEEARERLEALTEVADWLRREAAATMDTGYRGSFRPTVVQLERWAAVAERARCALAAAPPPPDVSRGLDREEVARLAYFMAVEGEASEEDARSPLNDGHWAHWKVHPDYQCCFRLADAIIALSAPAGGGEDAVGAAEREVGRWVYQRIEVLMDAKPDTADGAELTYLARVAEAVEEWGSHACGGDSLAPFPARWMPLPPAPADTGRGE
jgi:hypothetical protein